MILQLKDIALTFTRDKDSFKILNGLNLDVEKGKITALIGGNGAGKTTLFNIISGYQPDYTGNVFLFLQNEKVVDMRNTPPYQSRIGRLFQSKGLMPHLTLLENIKLRSDNTAGEIPFSYLFRIKKLKKIEDNKEAEAKLLLTTFFGQDNKYLEMLDKQGDEFSYGEQRLLSLVALKMATHRLWLLDEPTAGVNPVYVESIKDIIRKIRDAGISILLIEHNMQFVRDTADKVAYLDEGKIQFVGTPEEVINNQKVKNSYLGIE